MTAVLLVGPPAYGGEAVTFQNDVAHQGFAAEPTLDPPLREVWSWRTWKHGGRHRSITHPLVADGKVFFTTGLPGEWFGTGIYALDAGTGELLWWHALTPDGSWSDAAYMDGRVFAAGDDGLLQAFDADTGAPLWQTQFISGWGPPVADNGIVYMTDGWGDGGRLDAIRASDGKLLWPDPVPGHRSAPALSDTRAFAAYSCDTVLAVDRYYGTYLWKNTVHDCIGPSGKTPALHDGRLYISLNGVGDPTGKVLDAQTGRLVGTYPYGTIPAFKGNVGVFAEFAVPWGFGPHTLHARRLDTGATLWRTPGDGGFFSPPLIVNDTVYVGSGTGEIFGYNLQTGRQVWSANAGEGVAPPDEHNGNSGLRGLAAGQGLLLVPADDKLVAYAGADWKPPVRPQPPGAIHEPPDATGEPPGAPRSEPAADDARVCTLAACSSGVGVDIRSLRRRFPGARTVRLCLEDTCRRVSARADFVRVTNSSLHGGERRRVRLVVKGRRGRVLMRVVRMVRLRRLQPNTSACPPTCWYRSLGLDPRSRRLLVEGP